MAAGPEPCRQTWRVADFARTLCEYVDAVVLAGGDLRCLPLTTSEEFFGRLEEAVKQTWPKPKMLVIGFPSNPTAMCRMRNHRAPAP